VFKIKLGNLSSFTNLFWFQIFTNTRNDRHLSVYSLRASLKYYSTPTARRNHQGRSIVAITDDNGKPMRSQALKFASLAWGQVTPAAKLGTAGMPLRGFGRAFQVDHIDKDKTNNNVSNGKIMTKAEHNAKTRPSEAQIANIAMSKSSPCTKLALLSLPNA
jgi:hypothetical protein